MSAGGAGLRTAAGVGRRRSALAAVLLAACAGLGFALSGSRSLAALDQILAAEVRAACDGLSPLALALTWLGNARQVTVLVVAIVLALALRRRWRLSVWFAATVLTGWLGTELIKLLFDRARPLGVALIPLPASASYPSGHAATSAVFVTALVFASVAMGASAFARRGVLVVGTVLALGVGISRVCLGVHFPGDMLGGWLYGVGWGTGAALLLLPHLSGRATAVS